MSRKLIFIIGPARSGTHLVASSIASAFPDACYLPEINEFWSRYTINTTDRIDTDYYSSEKLETIRNDFFAFSNNAELIIEKTAANSLRTNFLRALFPDAQFVFVQRNCFQVIKSVLKKQSGNINKISASRKITFHSRLKTLLNRINAKLSKIEKRPAAIFNLVKDNSANGLNILNLKSDLYWGPKFCPLDTRKKIRHPELYAFLQWAACTTEIENLKFENSYNCIFLHFNEVTSEPSKTANRLNEFLECSDIRFNIDAKADTTVNKNDFEFYDLIKQLCSSLEKNNASC